MNYEEKYLQVLAMCNATMMAVEQMKGVAPKEEVLAVGMHELLKLVKEQLESEGIEAE